MLAWAVAMATLCAFLMPSHNSYFRVGPHSDMRVAGLIPIDTPLRYALMVAYTVVNCIMRTVSDEVVKPWMIHVVQNTSRDVEKGDMGAFARRALEVTILEALYSWYDFLSSLVIAFVQVDMLLVEMTCHLATSTVTTLHYCAKQRANQREL